ncbi:PRA1 family protein F3 [Canna indica]|uniref:PRA1 family protein n=1 Tax=Canna indica TaxID=4628 RepID=A0AAQ3QLX8_9LILI|nr:PRA1 family protein F3 [Canna indica]
MTTYGTIPVSTAPSSSSSSPSTLDFISRDKERGRSALASTRRPWRELADARALSLPSSFGETCFRARANAAHFSANYAVVVLVVRLLWHPVSLIVLLVCLADWLFLYLLRDEPLLVLGSAVGDGTVLAVLSAMTLVTVLLTGATTNVLVSLLIGVLLVLLHAALRRSTEEMVAVQEEKEVETAVERCLHEVSST